MFLKTESKSISSFDQYLRCTYKPVLSNKGETNDLGLDTEMIACSTAMHLRILLCALSCLCRGLVPPLTKQFFWYDTVIRIIVG